MTAVAFSTSAPAGHIPLRVLVIEDCDADAELLIAALERGGYEPTWKRVDTAAELEVALQEQRWDLITCDWAMPRFSGPAALALLRQRRCVVPIIVVSGQAEEEYVRTAIAGGARGFVSKHRLSRLCSAIERELKPELRHRQP